MSNPNLYSRIKQIYTASLKPRDSLFNIYLARPLAAPLVMVLSGTRVNPNQVSFVSLGVMILGTLFLSLLPGSWGLWLGVLAIESSYLLDCTDGQLARVTGRSSEVGASLDFLMDELKALLLILGVSLWWHRGGGGLQPLYLGLISLVVVSAALALTKFVRSPEYAKATGSKPLRHGEAAGAPRKGPLWPIEVTVRLVSQYPTTLPLFAAFGRMDLFLWAYGVIHLLYLMRTALSILLKLGHFAAIEEPPEEAV